MVSLGQGTPVSLIGAPSIYSSRQVFNELVDFKEGNFLFAPFLLHSKLSKQPFAYSHKANSPGCKKRQQKRWCNAVFTPGPRACAYVCDTGVNGGFLVGLLETWYANVHSWFSLSCTGRRLPVQPRDSAPIQPASLKSPVQTVLDSITNCSSKCNRKAEWCHKMCWTQVERVR